MFVLRQTNVFSELLTFHFEKPKIRKMIRNFHELQKNGGEIGECKRLCERAIEFCRRIFIFIFFILLGFNVFFYEKVQFFVPVIYEKQGIYDWISIIYFIHVLHCIIYVYITISIELLPMISVLKLEGLVASLCRRMEEVTSGDLRENEQKLDECIKFHVKVLK
jgi:hypothetical protein